MFFFSFVWCVRGFFSPSGWRELDFFSYSRLGLQVNTNGTVKERSKKNYFQVFFSCFSCVSFQCQGFQRQLNDDYDWSFPPSSLRWLWFSESKEKSWLITCRISFIWIRRYAFKKVRGHAWAFNLLFLAEWICILIADKKNQLSSVFWRISFL